MAEQHHYSLSSTTGKWTLTSCILASSMAFIDTSALNVVLPSLQTNLNASGTDLFWVLNSYLLMLTSLIIIGGSLGDKLGRVKIFRIGISLFTIASLLCGLSTTINQLIIFRTLQGIGGALMIPGSLSIISATFKPDERGKAIGSWSAITVLVTMGGPILGGALADAGLWRYIFFINIPLGIISVIMLYRQVPESKEDSEKQKIDWYGGILLALSLTAFTYGFLNIPELGIENSKSYLPIIFGLVFAVLFLYAESNVKAPMIPLSIFRNRTFSGINISTFFLYAGLSGVMLFLSLNVIQIQGYSQLQAGLSFLPFTVLMALIARKVGSLSDRYGVKIFLITGPIITAAGFIALGLIGKTSGPESFWKTFFPGIFLFGLGMSLTVVPLTSTVMGALPDRQAGIASGVNNSITRLSNTAINALLGAFAVFLFTWLIEKEVSQLKLEEKQKKAVVAESIQLAEAKPPELIKNDNKRTIASLYESNFITVYQYVCYTSAVFALLAALFSAGFIKEKRLKSNGSQ